MGIQREQFNEVRVSSSPKAWAIEAAIIPTREYPEGAWHEIEKGSTACNAKNESICLLRQVADSLRATVQRLKDEDLPPERMRLTIHVPDIEVAEVLRGTRANMALQRMAAKVTDTAKLFESFAIYLLATDTAPKTSPRRKNT